MGQDFWTALLRKVSDDPGKADVTALATLCQFRIRAIFMATVVSRMLRRMYRESLRSDDWQDFILSRQRVVDGLGTIFSEPNSENGK